MEKAADWPNTLSLAFVEELYARYLADAGSVSPDWREYFDGLGDVGPFADTPRIGPSFRPRSVFAAESGANGRAAVAGAVDALDFAVRQDRVDQLIRAYRVRGHMVAKIDPLGLPRPEQPELGLAVRVRLIASRVVGERGSP